MCIGQPASSQMPEGDKPPGDALRGYKTGIFAYYAVALAVLVALALYFVHRRQVDGWSLAQRGHVEPGSVSALTQSGDGEVELIDVHLVSTAKAEKPWPSFDPLVLLVAIAGALGGCLHGLASLSEHAGVGSLTRGWGPFYASLPVTAAGVALGLYFILRSGIAGVEISDSAPEFTCIAWAFLAGLFSTSALDKLGDIFRSLLPSQDG